MTATVSRLLRYTDINYTSNIQLLSVPQVAANQSINSQNGLPVEIWDQLIFLVAHAGPEMCDANIGLLRPAEIRLWNQNVAHRQHAETSELLRRVEHDRREPTRHLRVESDLDTCLDLVLTLDEKIEQVLRVDDRLAEVRHQANQSRVPLVHNLTIITIIQNEINMKI